MHGNAAMKANAEAYIQFVRHFIRFLSFWQLYSSFIVFLDLFNSYFHTPPHLFLFIVITVAEELLIPCIYYLKQIVQLMKHRSFAL